MVPRIVLAALMGALLVSGCASSKRAVRIESSMTPAPAAEPASIPADDPLLPQDPMSSEPATPMATDIVGEEPATEPQAEEYIQLSAAPAAVEAAPDGGQTYLLDAGDRVRVFVYGQPNLSRTYPIDGAGFISMPLVGEVKARGLTTYDLGANITALLGTDYVRDPQVAVEVVNYRPVFVIGEVRNAGQFSFQPGMTVETAVAVAGGYGPRANQQSFVITRTIDGAPAEIDASPFERVRPGDTIRVTERFF